VEGLEARVVLSVFTVSNTDDSGSGSLRQAILDADAATSGPITIALQIPTSDPNFVDDDSGLSGGDSAADVFVISPLSPLPALNNPNAAIIIDGGTQTAFTGDTNPFGPEVVLDGTSAGLANGLVILSGGNEVHGLDIRRFSYDGIFVPGGVDNWIAGNDIGTDATGTIALGNNGVGVAIVAGARSNIIGTDGDGVGDAAEGNLISGNGSNGVEIDDAGTSGNLVAGNLIGTDASGTRALANSNGVVIYADGNRVGVVGGAPAAMSWPGISSAPTSPAHTRWVTAGAASWPSAQVRAATGSVPTATASATPPSATSSRATAGRASSSTAPGRRTTPSRATTSAPTPPARSGLRMAVTASSSMAPPAI
jgi:hypothetical protein